MDGARSKIPRNSNGWKKINRETPCPSETHHDGVDFVNGATFIAVGTALILAFSSGTSGSGALQLWPLFSIGSVVVLLEIWMVVEGTLVLVRLKKNK